MDVVGLVMLETTPLIRLVAYGSIVALAGLWFLVLGSLIWGREAI